GFDGVPPYYLECLFTLRRKVLPGFRVVIRLRLLHVVPLVERHPLGRRRSLHCSNLSASSAERATTGSRQRGRGKRAKRGCGRGIERFDLGDNVGFWFGLSVKALNGRAT